VSTTAATGFCRVTVVAPDSRIDVALPEDIAVARREVRSKGSHGGVGCGICRPSSVRIEGLMLR